MWLVLKFLSVTPVGKDFIQPVKEKTVLVNGHMNLIKTGVKTYDTLTVSHTKE